MSTGRGRCELRLDGGGDAGLREGRGGFVGSVDVRKQLGVRGGGGALLAGGEVGVGYGSKGRGGGFDCGCRGGGWSERRHRRGGRFWRRRVELREQLVELSGHFILDGRDR